MRQTKACELVGAQDKVPLTTNTLRREVTAVMSHNQGSKCLSSEGQHTIEKTHRSKKVRSIGINIVLNLYTPTLAHPHNMLHSTFRMVEEFFSRRPHSTSDSASYSWASWNTSIRQLADHDCVGHESPQNSPFFCVNSVKPAQGLS
jgi:hypothetical protein